MTPLRGRAAAPLPLVLACVLASLGGCQKSVPGNEQTGATANASAAAAAEPPPGLQLKPEEVASLGVAVRSAQSASVVPEVQGYGLVVPHDALAQAVAELASAAATERQSRAALDRARHLAGTPGALSADVIDSAERQAAVDAAALELAQRRLTAMLGEHGPWVRTGGAGGDGDGGGAQDATLNALASGRMKLLRATLPLGSWNGAPPGSLRVAHLDAEPLAPGLRASRVWNAPADATAPGRSFFALLPDGEFSEGERVQVWAPQGRALAGVLVPAAALVISGGAYWCYLQKDADRFVRVAVDTAVPAPGGYLVTAGVVVGDRIVTAAAGLLLARELNPSTEAE